MASSSDLLAVLRSQTQGRAKTVVSVRTQTHRPITSVGDALPHRLKREEKQGKYCTWYVRALQHPNILSRSYMEAIAPQSGCGQNASIQRLHQLTPCTGCHSDSDTSVGPPFIDHGTLGQSCVPASPRGSHVRMCRMYLVWEAHPHSASRFF